MTDYINLEDEEIIYFVFNINWSLPKETQKEAISVLSQLPPDKVDMIIPKYGKGCWENGVFILKEMGYPRNKKALPKLARQLQDINWPGTLGAIEIFRSIGKQISTPYIEKECDEAIECNDTDWLEHLQFACDSLGITAEDFNDKTVFYQMEELAEE
ncbi:hypothetical protein ABES25_07215 [Bacillus gobiensis]|uniref:hypothetical protein n=1 Tax=Bacillus gobiensis TaxID=1441095 RepID=UPI003D247255